jgi:hypothetical protein
MTAIGWFILRCKATINGTKCPFDSAQDDDVRSFGQLAFETTSGHLPITVSVILHTFPRSRNL